MKRENFYISTIAPDAEEMARKHGMGLEIAEFCAAYNMDMKFKETDPVVKEKIAGVEKRVLHAPYSELFPCAIDPMVRDVARYRYRQALKIAQDYGATKVIIHGGYNPRIYYPIWYSEQSVVFWKEFLDVIPEGMEICLENVLEEEPEMMIKIFEGIDSPKIRMCLDIGHVNFYSKLKVQQWLERCAPFISHFHIHNNDESWDTHSNLDEGTIPMKEVLEMIRTLCPDATYALEVLKAEPAVKWLIKNGVIK